QQKEFAAIEKQALHPTDSWWTRVLSRERRDVVVQAGMTQVWNIPARRATGVAPDLVLAGTQAVRITMFDRGGALLQDLEHTISEEPATVAIPARAARIAITGLGISSLPQRDGPIGTVTLSD